MPKDSFEIIGFGGEPVPNEMFCHPTGSHRLALILPGMGYTTAMPLLYYTGETLLHRRYDVLLVDYDYRALPGPIEDSAFEDRFHADIEAAMTSAFDAGSYDSVVLVGKSLGTLGVAHLVEQDRWPITAGVWFTPLLRRDAVRALIDAQRNRAFVVIGDADSHYDADIVNRLESSLVDTVVIGGADHGMDIPGEVTTSIYALAQIVTRFEVFLDRVFEPDRSS